MTQTIRSEFHTATANLLANDIQLNKASYYYYLGRVDPWLLVGDEPGNTAPVLSQEEDDRIRENIIYVRKIVPNDISLVILRRDWVTGVVYDRWDNSVAMVNKSFYVVNSDHRVYKCLDNNNGTLSTVEPIAVNYNVFKTTDGYLWKYMYSIPTFKWTKFTGGPYIPVQKALSDNFYNKGTIEEVVVENGGTGYNNINPTTIVVSGGTKLGSGVILSAVTNAIGTITSVTITNGGGGYTAGAQLSITSTTGSGAVLTAVISGVSNAITGVTVVNGGVGYGAVGDAININPLPVILATLDNNGSIVDITVMNSGGGYSVAPTLTVNQSPATGTGLYAGNTTAKMTAVINGGKVVRVLVSDPGIGYPFTANTVNIIGDGTGAVFIPVVYGGSVVDLVAQNVGSGYTFANVTVSGGTGSGVILKANIGRRDFQSDQPIVEQTTTPGAIYAVKMINNGSGYSNLATVSITGDGTGATAVPIIANGGVIGISMTTYGRDYTRASVVIEDLSRVSAPSLTDALADVIHGPIKGHGYDATLELNAKTVAINTVIQAEGTLNALSQDYRQYGILRNPTLYTTDKFARLNKELICFKISTSASTGTLVKDEVLKNGLYRYRVAGVDPLNSSNVYLQPLNKKYVVPNGALISTDNARTYSISNVIDYPTINKYSGSLMLLSNEVPFQFTTEQGLAIKTYLKL